MTGAARGRDRGTRRPAYLCVEANVVSGDSSHTGGPREPGYFPTEIT